MTIHTISIELDDLIEGLYLDIDADIEEDADGGLEVGVIEAYSVAEIDGVRHKSDALFDATGAYFKDYDGDLKCLYREIEERLLEKAGDYTNVPQRDDVRWA